MEYDVVLTREDKNKWTAEVPALPGCITWGESREQVLLLAEEAIEGWIASRRQLGKEVPSERPVVELARVDVG